MHLAGTRTLIMLILSLFLALTCMAQDLRRELSLAAGGELTISNIYGRVGIKAVPGDVKSVLEATSKDAVVESDVKTAGGVITVTPADKQRRIDLVVTVPERMRVRVDTRAGEIQLVGNFAVVEARSDTGTIITDVPAEDLSYHLLWTESRPRYISDFDMSPVKEKAAGKFELKG